MIKKHAQYSQEFKAKIALASMRGEETVAQLAARYHIHPTQINSWKRHLIEKASDLFGKDYRANTKSGHSVDDLHRMIGQLTVERDFLARKLDH